MVITTVMGGLGQEKLSPEPLERVRQRWESDPYVRLLGIEIVDFSAGRARLSLPLAEKILNGGQGVAHGGSLCSAMDIAIGIALNAANAEAAATEGPMGQTTTDLNVTFLAGAREGPLTIEAELIRRGGTLAVGEATVRDANGQIAAVGRATFMIIRRRSGSAEGAAPLPGGVGGVPPASLPQEPPRSRGGEGGLER
jgi:uncharacterized protein (TIGR00369 family)